MAIKCAKGSTEFSLAVVRGEKERVLELLHENADVNARDMLGRTPLMEAALWGHVEVTKILLESKANPTKTDKEGRQAVDLAEECDRNDEEREERHLNYIEKPSEKKRARRIIRGLLGAVPSSGNSLVKSLKSYYAARIYKCRNLWTASLVLPIVGVEIKHEHQTVAFLDRDEPFDMIHAASGWSGSGHCPRSGHYEKLDANYWTAQALNLARKIGLPFPFHPRDGNMMIGTYNACHAEAQLVAFFVEHHLPIVEATNYPSENLFSQQCRKQNPIQKAKIIVSQDPCDSGMAFITCVMCKQNCDFEIVVAREIVS
ncbi:ankyrin repeat protein [Colletotrichum truncatum]|uniref:Ankyrin repeat protein n=1 Tax=Colletotrichum truncatum TaxID=5467 RepID=A0ACC3YCS0_COLTU|nr:ankyrin repeat protein [Colletotrichum truncatum]KAF6793979.1 ankyrin repeat protein [Colletotrichum truncatum]